MKIFISWSGERSRRIAETLKKWIPCVLQFTEPYCSSKDIDKGARWSNEIAKELDSTNFGILCVTKENVDSPWLNFEAGALSKSLEDSLVCPLLIDLEQSDISSNSPVSQFQMTKNLSREEIYQLLGSINSNSDGESIGDSVLSCTYNGLWSQFSNELEIAKADTGDADTDKEPTETDVQSTIEEMLQLLRSQQRLLNSPSDLLPPEYIASILGLRPSIKNQDKVYRSMKNRQRDLKIAAKSLRSLQEQIEAGVDPSSPELVQKISNLSRYINDLSDSEYRLLREYGPYPANRYFHIYRESSPDNTESDLV